MSKVVFSGIQPSGNLHIGNYIGAIKTWAKSQEDGLNIFCVVDEHAITVEQDPKKLSEKTLEIAGIVLAGGVDPKKSLLFVQSHNPDHTNLAWKLNCVTSMGQLSRMTQFKEKSEGKDAVSVGLFDYPVLMAADILLYDTTEVPVGEDQKQHVELTRDIAERFNSRFGETFVLPKPVIPEFGGRIMSLVDPTKKMSKSDANPNATIHLLDTEEEVRRKIGSATTDGGHEILYREDKPGISNLIEIYCHLAAKEISEVEKEFEGKTYKEFKDGVAEATISFLKDFQSRYEDIRSSDNLTKVLEEGARKAREISSKKLSEVKNKMGFV